MPSDTKNVKLGVCTVLFDGVDLGLTKGGVEVEVSTSTHEVKVDQYGETPISELVTGRQVSAKVPLAETTLENLVRTMPGTTLVTDGVKATGTVTFSTAAPVNGDKVVIGGIDFTFKTAPAALNDMAIPASFTAAATALAAAVNAYPGVNVTAVAAAGVVTLTAVDAGTWANSITLSKTAVTAANVTVSGATLTGGSAATKAKAVVTSGINVNLLDVAKKLVLRPKGSTGADDFIILRAATAGAMNFAYKTDDERVFNVTFKGYPMNDGSLIVLGNEAAA